MVEQGQEATSAKSGQGSWARSGSQGHSWDSALAVLTAQVSEIEGRLTAEVGEVILTGGCELKRKDRTKPIAFV